MGIAALFSLAAVAGVALWKMDAVKELQADALAYTASGSSAQSSVDASWQQEMMLLGIATSTGPTSASSEDPLDIIGPLVATQLAGAYVGMQEQGGYTEETGAQVAQEIATNIKAVVTHKTYSSSEIRTADDTSSEAALSYRAAMQKALSPLLQNRSSELELYANYVDSKDETYLGELQKAAQNYRAAASNAAALTVPKDAAAYHRAALNAIEQFAATIDAMTSHTDDPFASAALLRTYNTAESDMYFSFNSLASYWRAKVQ